MDGQPINKRSQQRAVMENRNWFNHYIWGDPLAPKLTPVVSAPEKKDKP